MPLARGLNRKISHHKRILSSQIVSKNSLIPGMILFFTYNVAGVYDRRPMLFLMQKEGEKIHGVNLNYLQETLVQKFFSACHKLTPIVKESIMKTESPYSRLTLKTQRATSAVSSQILYKKIFPRDRHYKEVYRTYFLNKATSIKLVNYKFDILEKEKK